MCGVVCGCELRNHPINAIWTGLVFIITYLFISVPFIPSGNSALHSADRIRDHDTVTKMLIENGADLNIVNKNGLTPLESAINDGNLFRCDMKLQITSIKRIDLVRAVHGRSLVRRIFFIRTNKQNNNVPTNERTCKKFHFSTKVRFACLFVRRATFTNVRTLT